jgi:aminopeptidase
MSSTLPPTVHRMGLQNVRDTLHLALRWRPEDAAVVVYDRQSPMAQILSDLYHEALPDVPWICFDDVVPSEIFAAFDRLKPGDLVVLVQSTSFRLEAFRLRVELFKRGLKVAEHPHLARMTDSAISLYLESLAYDPDRLRPLGARLKEAVASASRAEVRSKDGGILVCSGPFEPASLNVGDYAATKNVGGQFPIGEVFTEAVDLTLLEGRFSLFAYGDKTFTVSSPPSPIVLHVAGGQVVGTENSTPEFESILEQIRTDEGVVWIREWGFGLNKAFSPTRTIADVGTFERMNGLHFSLGAKHAIYPKVNFRRKDGKHHVDVFVDLESFSLGDRTVFENGDWF